MKPELQDVLRQATVALCRELDPDNELRPQLRTILTHQQHDSVYVQIIYSLTMFNIFNNCGILCDILSNTFVNCNFFT